jgi:lysozyme family protein
MKRFNLAFQYMLGHEGTFTEKADDPGSATKFGISLNLLQTINDKRFDKDEDGFITRNDIISLTQNDAMLFYEEYFWHNQKFDELQDKDIALKLFDSAVSFGIPRCAKIAQATCNIVISELKINLPLVKVDYMFGESTIQSINSLPKADFLITFKNNCAQWYISICEQYPMQTVFLSRQINRAFDSSDRVKNSPVDIPPWALKEVHDLIAENRNASRKKHSL